MLCYAMPCVLWFYWYAQLGNNNTRTLRWTRTLQIVHTIIYITRMYSLSILPFRTHNAYITQSKHDAKIYTRVLNTRITSLHKHYIRTFHRHWCNNWYALQYITPDCIHACTMCIPPKYNTYTKSDYTLSEEGTLATPVFIVHCSGILYYVFLLYPILSYPILFYCLPSGPILLNWICSILMLLSAIVLYCAILYCHILSSIVFYCLLRYSILLSSMLLSSMLLSSMLLSSIVFLL